MKEVKKCSISGVAFTMDADAYQELENYLDSLKKTYKDTPDGAEIVADIEARIAERLDETLHHVGADHVRAIARQPPRYAAPRAHGSPGWPRARPSPASARPSG